MKDFHYLFNLMWNIVVNFSNVTYFQIETEYLMYKNIK